MADAATWSGRVAQWKASGLTAADFAQGRGFAPATLLWWSSRLRARDAALRPGGFPMARVMVANEGAAAASVASAVAQNAGSGVSLEVGGARVLVQTGFDRPTLAAVLEVLELREEVRR